MDTLRWISWLKLYHNIREERKDKEELVIKKWGELDNCEQQFYNINPFIHVENVKCCPDWFVMIHCSILLAESVIKCSLPTPTYNVSERQQTLIRNVSSLQQACRPFRARIQVVSTAAVFTLSTNKQTLADSNNT